MTGAQRRGQGGWAGSPRSPFPPQGPRRRPRAGKRRAGGQRSTLGAERTPVLTRYSSALLLSGWPGPSTARGLHRCRGRAGLPQALGRVGASQGGVGDSRLPPTGPPQDPPAPGHQPSPSENLEPRQGDGLSGGTNICNSFKTQKSLCAMAGLEHVACCGDRALPRKLFDHVPELRPS